MAMRQKERSRNLSPKHRRKEGDHTKLPKASFQNLSMKRKEEAKLSKHVPILNFENFDPEWLNTLKARGEEEKKKK